MAEELEVATGEGGAATNKTLKLLAKIKAKEWKAMGETVEQMRDFTGGMDSLAANLKETLSLQVENALAPLMNEVDAAVMEALAPIMPLISEFLTEVGEMFSLGLGAITALIEGDWDEFIKKETIDFQKDMENLEGPLRDAHTMIQKFQYMWTHDRGLEAIGLGFAGFRRDVGLGWAGFWRDLGWE